MSGKEKGRLAAAVVDQHCAFEEALAGNRKRYPRREFRSFALHDGGVLNSIPLKDYRPRSLYQIPNTRVAKAQFSIISIHS